MAARAPAQPIAENIQVARAEAPEASLTPARLSEDPDRVQLFPPRAGSNPCSARLARAIPRRPGNAAPASAILASLGNGSGSGRDDALVAEAMRGNVPDHVRALQPVRFTGAVGGRETEIVICVTPDYLAVGSNADHVRVPLGLPAALRVADGLDMMLPTTRMVDAIYAQAALRLSPRPMTPGPQMSSTDYFLRHDATLDAQMAQAGGRHGVLLAGHKKDLVLANRLSSNRGRVAIYGWHRGNGDPIQPLSTVHGEYYADYSHGIRLVSRTAYVDGRPVDLRRLLTDSVYAALLNSDGPLFLRDRSPRVPLKINVALQGADAREKRRELSRAVPCLDHVLRYRGSSGNRGGSCGGCLPTSRGCRARTARASATSARARGSCPR